MNYESNAKKLFILCLSRNNQQDAPL